MEELVSVIVPVYNVEAYLPHCLECIEAQTYKNLEIILVDDGSTDGSGRICDEYAAKDPRARVIHQPNTGCWAARNAGQDAATGEYLWFPDGDDYFHKDIIRLMYEAINTVGEDGNKYDLAVVEPERTDSMEIDVSSEVEVEYSVYSSQDELMQGMFVTQSLTPSVWNRLFRRKQVDSIRNEKFTRSQDWDYCFKVFLKINNAIKITNQLYYWFNRPGSSINRSDYTLLFARDKTMMLYKNYFELPADKKQYGHYLLHGIYRQIIDSNERLWTCDDRKVVEKQFVEIIHKTWFDYLRCAEIPFRKRMNSLCRAKFPTFSHWIMKVQACKWQVTDMCKKDK